MTPFYPIRRTASIPESLELENQVRHPSFRATLETEENRRTMKATKPSPTHHILVDFENIREVDPAIFGSLPFTFTLLLGAQQKKLDVALVEKLIEHSASVQLVRLTSSGKNALDFALAYHLGRASATEPNARFHIVSKDTGFDPLVEYLKSKRINVQRHPDYTAIANLSKTAGTTPASPSELDEVKEHLKKNAKSRPKKRKTLESSLAARFPKTAQQGGISALVDRLVSHSIIRIDEKNSVEYFL